MPGDTCRARNRAEGASIRAGAQEEADRDAAREESRRQSARRADAETAAANAVLLVRCSTFLQPHFRPCINLATLALSDLHDGQLRNLADAHRKIDTVSQSNSNPSPHPQVYATPYTCLDTNAMRTSGSGGMYVHGGGR